MRPFFVRLIAALLLTYGLAGLVAGALGAGRASELFRDTRRVMVSANAADSSGPARSLSRTLGSAAGATASGSESLGRAQESLRAGAMSASEVAQAMAMLTQAMSFDIFGSRPFADVAAPLARSSQRLDELADSLNSTERALDANRNDFDRLERDLRDLQVQSNQIADRLSSATDTDALSQTLSSVEWLANLLIAMFVLQSLLFLAIGAALLLVAPSRGEVTQEAAQEGDAL